MGQPDRTSAALLELIVAYCRLFFCSYINTSLQVGDEPLTNSESVRLSLQGKVRIAAVQGTQKISQRERTPLKCYKRSQL